MAPYKLSDYYQCCEEHWCWTADVASVPSAVCQWIKIRKKVQWWLCTGWWQEGHLAAKTLAPNNPFHGRLKQRAWYSIQAENGHMRCTRHQTRRPHNLQVFLSRLQRWHGSSQHTSDVKWAENVVEVQSEWNIWCLWTYWPVKKLVNWVTADMYASQSWKSISTNLLLSVVSSIPTSETAAVSITSMAMDEY